MFGIIRPCRNRLSETLRRDWLAHLCGMCLNLRDEHGHAARLVTNYDAIVVSALVDAQSSSRADRRTAGPCALRGMRGAAIVRGDAARLAGTVSLLLAAAKLRDHVADGEAGGPVRTRAARLLADRAATAGSSSAGSLGFDAVAVLDAAAGQTETERQPATLLEVTAPTEAATALAFAHTATLAGRPENAASLSEIGRLFGRLAHLLDAVEDLAADRQSGSWNPILALGLSPDDVRRYCDDAVLGIRLALNDVRFDDDRLVHTLLAHEPATAVRRSFTRARQPTRQPPEQTGWEAPPANEQQGRVAACLASLAACGTCQACRSSDDEHGDSRCGKVGDCCGECCGDCCCDAVCDAACNC